MNETLKVSIAVIVLLAIGVFAFQYKTHEKITDDSAKSGDYVDIPSIGISDSYKEYSATFKTFHTETYGFSFKYPPHLEVVYMDSTHLALTSVEEPSENDRSAIIVSIGENDENMTPEQWLLSPNSGYKQSEDQYGKYFKTTIDGQTAVYTDGGMWNVVNTPNNKYRLSIATMGSPLFSEMGIIIETLRFD